MALVNPLPETDATVPEQDEIEKQAPVSGKPPHDPVGIDTQDAPKGGPGRLWYPERPKGSDGAKAPGPGDGEALNAVLATGNAGPEAGIYKGGVKADDTYDHPDGAPAADQSADVLGNETGLNGDTPAAGDVDPDSTYVAEETGQDGDPTRPGKSHGHPWNQ